MYPVWKSFLEGTMQVAQSRISICENYKNFISEPARTVRSLKEQQLKRCVDQLTKIQTELQETVKDLAKGKKKYFETEQMAHAVREKADIEAKVTEPILPIRPEFLYWDISIRNILSRWFSVVR
ncbi:F-BAR and double SH3 domains protein 2-like isoform 2-T2 [Trichechus inunguis]